MSRIHEEKAPTLPFRKLGGTWTFAIYPDGLPREEGIFLTESDAVEHRNIAHQQFEKNGSWYQGNVSGLPRQGKVVA